MVKDYGMPYLGVQGLLIIADSGNNRVLVLDRDNLKFLEQIGNGRQGHKDSDFKDAIFNQPQGVCCFYNEKEELCLLVCDTKNHMIR